MEEKLQVWFKFNDVVVVVTSIAVAVVESASMLTTATTGKVFICEEARNLGEKQTSSSQAQDLRLNLTD